MTLPLIIGDLSVAQKYFNLWDGDVNPSTTRHTMMGNPEGRGWKRVMRN